MHLDMHQGESWSLMTPATDSPARVPLLPLGAVLTLRLPRDELGKLWQDCWSFCQGSLW